METNQRHVVCRGEDLWPGDIRSVKAGGRRIAVAHLPDGGYRAVADTCPHEMASLGHGKVEKMWTAEGVGKLRASEKRCVIVCPWHNFEFDLDTGLSPLASPEGSGSRPTGRSWSGARSWCTPDTGAGSSIRVAVRREPTPPRYQSDAERWIPWPESRLRGALCVSVASPGLYTTLPAVS